MNKRKFLSTLGGIALGCFLGAGHKVLKLREEFVEVSRTYINAEYEVVFLMSADAYKSLNVGPPPKTIKYEPGMFSNL